jgi:hypothetical protein
MHDRLALRLHANIPLGTTRSEAESNAHE